MKKFLLASSALLLVTANAASAQDKTLTISVYGFAQDAFKELVYTPFEQKCGCKLVVETGNSVERLAKMEANKASPVVDMAVVSMADALSATRADLIEKIDTSKLQNFNKLYDLAKDPNGDGMATRVLNDVTIGSYEVSVEMGPSFSTKREEAREGMQALMQALGPEGAVLFADLYVKSQDFPLADKIAKRAQMVLPPAIQQMEAQESGEPPMMPPQQTWTPDWRTRANVSSRS